MNKVIRYFAKRLSYKASYPLCKPVEMVIDITKRCNFRCTHCDVWKNQFSQEDLGTKEWKDIIANLRNYFGVYRLVISGGEPLLREDIFEILTLAKKLGIYTILNTNGSLISEDVADKLVKLVSEIRISLYGIALEHDKLRNVKNAYSQAVAAIDFLKAKRGKNLIPKIVIALMLNAENLKNIEKHLIWIKKNNFSVLLQILGENTTQSVGDYYKNHAQDWYLKSKLWPRQKGIVKKAFKKINNYRRQGLNIINSSGWVRAAEKYFLDPKEIMKINCFVAYDALHINFLGEALLCYHSGVIDNLVGKDIASLWNSKKWNQARKNLKNCKMHCRARLGYYARPADYLFDSLKKI
jgi:MoaA/NifB/PqqE/SkfB family radical SAM enzyme